MILSDNEIIGIKDYAELIGKLRLIAKDCHWQLLEDAADTIDKLRDTERQRDVLLEALEEAKCLSAATAAPIIAAALASVKESK